MDTILESISFKEVMTAHMFSPTEIAESINARSGYVYRWMNESRKIPALYRTRLESALGMKTPDSWYGEEERLPNGSIRDLSEATLSWVLESVKAEMNRRLQEKEETLYSQQKELTKKIEELQSKKKEVNS